MDAPERPDPAAPPPAPGAPAPEPAPDPDAPAIQTEGRSRGLLPGMLQFFVVPLLLVGVSLAIFAGLGALVGRGSPSSEDVLTRIAEGGKNERWQAAMELSNRVAQGDVELAQDERLVAAIRGVFENALEQGDDPRVLMFLSRFLAASGDPSVRPSLEAAATTGDPGVRIYAVHALAELGDPDALPALVDRLGDSEDGVRKTAAFALGVLGEGADPAARETIRPALVRALEDRAVDVRWNAATALARLGFPDGDGVLWEMLHPDHVRARLVLDPQTGLGSFLSTEGSDPATADQLEQAVLLNALSAVYRTKDRSTLEQVRRLAADHPSPRVQDFALKVVGVLEAAIAEQGPVDPRPPLPKESPKKARTE